MLPAHHMNDEVYKLTNTRNSYTCWVIVFYTSILNIFSLLEKGRQILMKDNLIDEDKAKEEEAAQETFEQKMDRIGKNKNTVEENMKKRGVQL